MNQQQDLYIDDTLVPVGTYIFRWVDTGQRAFQRHLATRIWIGD